MILLDSTTKSLEVKLGGVVATTQLPFVASYVDANQSTFALTTMGENDGTTNSTTAVTMVAAPAATTTRKVNYISIVNLDTAAATVTVQLNNNGTLRTTFKVTLQVGDQLQFVDEHGWSVRSSTGNLLTSGSTGNTGTQGPMGMGIPGRDGDDGWDGWPGHDGATGATGATGVTGPQGPVGTGVPGRDGDDADTIWPMSVPAAAATGGTPGGSDKQIQYNDSGVFGAEAGFEYDKATNIFSAPGLVDLSAAAAGQIKFPATQNASSDVNTLDDYEEGTWTPVLGGSGGTSGQTYSAQVGTYVKIGQFISASYQLSLTNKGTITTNCQIQGLPFAAAAGQYFISNLQRQGMATNWVEIVTAVNLESTTKANLTGAAAAGTANTTNIVTTDFNSSGAYLSGTIVYRAAA